MAELHIAPRSFFCIAYIFTIFVDLLPAAHAAVDTKVNEKTLKMGGIMRCVFCQEAVKHATHPICRKKSEDQAVKLLNENCVDISSVIANHSGTSVEESETFCKRVVKEYSSDILDAVSLGENVNRFCTKEKICQKRGKDAESDQIIDYLAEVVKRFKNTEGTSAQSTEL
eukprot:TRINITY_DN82198_c0_g1_i2.p1 TRINITY_DN82198_c0_g1~~TRINITY_DN82198_c0_g1_i2.p1  ORF type:complete len:184 (-),score=23.50 TRINITY_DN82198_c0_g1_i2:111-620(-)